MGACLSAPPQGSGGKREGISPKDSSRAPTADGGAAAKGPSATSLSTSATDGPEQPHGPPNKADSAAVPAAVAPAPPHGHTAPHAAKANDAAGPVDPSNSNGNGRSSGGGKELTQPTVEERKFACTLNRSGQLFAGTLDLLQEYLSFTSKILTTSIDLQVMWNRIATVEKSNTAKIIPNALTLNLKDNSKIFFSGFKLPDRELAYTCIRQAVAAHQ
mmetsp:Transcript_2564/g.9298  ORF Transcript_2564/g.9298 Transcript_2564/m.9298 type:complete len:216 (+) Transcript_2564:97-744(+)